MKKSSFTERLARYGLDGKVKPKKVVDKPVNSEANNNLQSRKDDIKLVIVRVNDNQS